MTASTAGLVVPQMEVEFYGIPVSAFGEGGDMIALGHHEPRKALAAFRKLGRSYGLDDFEVFGDHEHREASPILWRIAHQWVTFKDYDGEWRGTRAGNDASTPGALAVTVYESGW